MHDGLHNFKVVLGENAQATHSSSLILHLSLRRVDFLKLASKDQIVSKGRSNFGSDVASFRPITPHVHLLDGITRDITKTWREKKVQKSNLKSGNKDTYL
jgi:hypothetical protein